MIIEWDNTDNEDTMSIKITGTCIGNINGSVEMSLGTYTISSEEFETDEEDEEISCPVDIILERRYSGTLANEFGSGEIFGGYRQVKSIELNP